MNNNFETRFSGYQSDIISLCLEYCDGKCDKIYVHANMSDGTVFTNFFYRINGVVRKKHKLSDTNTTVSYQKQKAALKIITTNVWNIVALFEEFKRQVPCEMKIIYNANDKSIKANYSYEPKAVMSDVTITEAWFKEIEEGQG